MLSMKQKHVLLGVTPLSRFMNTIDCLIHRVNIVYLVNGYFPWYSFSMGCVLLFVLFTFWCPGDFRLYSSLVSFVAQSFSLLMVASGIFCASGGVFSRRQHQENWILGNVKDAAHALVNAASYMRAAYALLVLEVLLEIRKVFSELGCVCMILLGWMGWLTWREWGSMRMKMAGRQR